MYVISWRAVSALTRVLTWYLFPSLLCNSENKHQNNPLVSAETICHSSTYIIIYLSFIYMITRLFFVMRYKAYSTRDKIYCKCKRTILWLSTPHICCSHYTCPFWSAFCHMFVPVIIIAKKAFRDKSIPEHKWLSQVQPTIVFAINMDM